MTEPYIPPTFTDQFQIMTINTETSAALVFLILYALIFIFMLFGYSTGRLILRSRYTIILFHVSLRLASQATAVAFGIVGFADPHLLVAYFVLGGKSFGRSSHPLYFLLTSQLQLKDTLHLCCAHITASLLGSTVTFPRTTLGSNLANHRVFRGTSGYWSRFLQWWTASFVRCLLFIFSY